jgi:hypothetical protein
VLCRAVDGYCRFFAPRTVLRRKLVLLLALWECDPASREDLQLERPVRAVWIGLRIASRLLGCGLTTLAALLCLAPLKLFTPRGAHDGKPLE